MKWSFIKGIILLLFYLSTPLSAGEWSTELRRMGMENIREVNLNESCYLSWEDPVYRGSCRGLAEVIRLIARKSMEEKDFYLPHPADSTIAPGRGFNTIPITSKKLG